MKRPTRSDRLISRELNCLHLSCFLITSDLSQLCPHSKNKLFFLVFSGLVWMFVWFVDVFWRVFVVVSVVRSWIYMVIYITYYMFSYLILFYMYILFLTYFYFGTHCNFSLVCSESPSSWMWRHPYLDQLRYEGSFFQISQLGRLFLQMSPANQPIPETSLFTTLVRYNTFVPDD